MSETRPLKVLHVASGDLWAGAEAQLFTLARALQKRGDTDVHVALLNEGELAQRLRAANIAVYVFPENKLGFPQLLLRVMGLARKLKPDVIHTHRVKENLLGGLTGLLLGIPSVRTVHGASEHVADWKKPHKLLIAKMDQWLATFVQKKTIAVTQELALKLQEFIPVSRIAVVENGIDPENFSFVDFSQLDLRFQKAKRRVGIVGRLVPVKRVDIFIEMAALFADDSAFDDVEFFVIGDGPLRSELEGLTNERKLENKIHFLGHQTAIHSYLKALDALVMCSDHEGMPMTLLEAMSLKIPFVGHDVGGIRLLLQNDQCGFSVQKNNTQAHYEALHACLLDTADAKSRALKAYVNVDDHFSSRENANQIRQIYENASS